MFHYHCYGLNVSSEVELAALLPSEFKLNDVIVSEKSEIIFDANSAQFVNGFWVNKNHQVFFEVEFGSMLISEGKTIDFSLKSSDLIEDAVQHVLGSGFGAILLQRKRLVLHASAIERNGQAVLFIGRSGAGKSSTAWSFVNNGYQLISDDLAVNSFENDTPYIHMGFPRSKIAEDVILKREGRVDESEKYIEESRKKYYRYSEISSKAKVQIGHIITLTRNEVETPTMSEENKLYRFQSIYRNCYRFKLIKPLGFSKFHLQLCMKLFSKVTSHSIELPNHKLTLNATFKLLNKLTKG